MGSPTTYKDSSTSLIVNTKNINREDILRRMSVYEAKHPNYKLICRYIVIFIFKNKRLECLPQIERRK